MKKIGRIVLHNNAELLDTPEMKMIRGGYSSGGGYDKDCCAWRLESEDDTVFRCADETTSQEEGAVPHWWACNSQAVKDACGCGK